MKICISESGIFMIQKQLFISFFRSGLVGFGGGAATIPLIEKEVVEQYQMLTADEFYEIMAIGNTLPGPIITKMAGYIGYRVGGVLGMVNATLAAILPSIIMMIVLFNLLYKIEHPSMIQGMMTGVLPVISVMMFTTFLDCLKKTNHSFGVYKGIVAIIVGFITIAVIHIDSALVICSVIIVALVLPVKEVQK